MKVKRTMETTCRVTARGCGEWGMRAYVGSGRCENVMTGVARRSAVFTQSGDARLFLVSAGLIVTILLDGSCRFGVNGHGWLFWVQAWEGKIRDFMHLVVPRKCE